MKVIKVTKKHKTRLYHVLIEMTEEQVNAIKKDTTTFTTKDKDSGLLSILDSLDDIKRVSPFSDGTTITYAITT